MPTHLFLSKKIKNRTCSKKIVAYYIWASKKSLTVGKERSLQGPENRALRKISDSKKHKASNLKYYVRGKR